MNMKWIFGFGGEKQCIRHCANRLFSENVAVFFFYWGSFPDFDWFCIRV